MAGHCQCHQQCALPCPVDHHQEPKSACDEVQAGMTSIPLTDQMYQQSEWTPAVLKEQQGKLLDLCKRCWGL